MRITTKFNIITSCLLLILFMFMSYISYQNDRDMAVKVTIDKARAIAYQIIATREYLSEVVRTNEVEKNLSLTPQVAATHIAQRLTKGTPYYIRQVSLRYRNPANIPDDYEKKILKGFESPGVKEHFDLLQENGNEVLRYILPMVAEKTCLTCHGDYKNAPEFVKKRFPQGHSSYNYKTGEIIGAISVSVPMNDLYASIVKDLKKELAIQGGILALLLLVTGWLIHRIILAPVSKVAEGIEAVAGSGNFSNSIDYSSKDEIGRLVKSFNELMSELERRTHQRTESDERYRNFIEIAQSPIVTFIQDGKVVIANKKAETLFGLSKEELLGQSIFDFMANPEPLREAIANYFLIGNSDLIGTTSRQTVRDICGRQFDVEMVISVSQTEQEAMFSAILRAARDQ